MLVSKYQDALRELWTGLCDVFTLSSIVNPTNGRNESEEILERSGLPCRISFSNVSSTEENNDAALVRQTIKLFIANDVVIPPGSKLVITQAGKTDSYVKSGEPAVYSTHQEIVLERFKGWA